MNFQNFLFLHFALSPAFFVYTEVIIPYSRGKNKRLKRAGKNHKDFSGGFFSSADSVVVFCRFVYRTVCRLFQSSYFFRTRHDCYGSDGLCRRNNKARNSFRAVRLIVDYFCRFEPRYLRRFFVCYLHGGSRFVLAVQQLSRSLRAFFVKQAKTRRAKPEYQEQAKSGENLRCPARPSDSSARIANNAVILP